MSALLFDKMLVGLGAIIEVANASLYTVYVVARTRRKGRRGDASEDITSELKGISASLLRWDRPLWIGIDIVAGAVWILSSLVLAGSLGIHSIESEVGCIEWRWFGQATFGYCLFVTLVLYRTIRIWQAWSRNAKPWHALVLISALLAPMAVFSVAALLLTRPSLSIDDMGGNVCVDSLPAKTALHVACFMYVPVTLFFTIKLHGPLQSLPKMAPLIFFQYLAFFGMLANMLVDFVWTKEVWARQLVAAVVVAIVASQSGTIWALLWAERRKERLEEARFATESIALQSYDIGKLARKHEPGMQQVLIRAVDPFGQDPTELQRDMMVHRPYLERRAQFHTEKAAEQGLLASLLKKVVRGTAERDRLAPSGACHFRVPDDFEMSQPAATIAAPLQHRFGAFLESVSEEDRARIDRSSGYFHSRSTFDDASQAIMESDLAAAELALGVGSPTAPERHVSFAVPKYADDSDANK